MHAQAHVTLRGSVTLQDAERFRVPAGRYDDPAIEVHSLTFDVGDRGELSFGARGLGVRKDGTVGTATRNRYRLDGDVVPAAVTDAARSAARSALDVFVKGQGSTR